MGSRLIEDLKPGAREKCREFLKAANAALLPLGLKLFLTCTYRPQSEQDALYAQGRTTPGHIVTYTRRSCHTQRQAWDVAFASAASWKKNVHPYEGHEEAWATIGAIGRKLGLTWGGNWKGKKRDRPHFQV